jgi:hypothetical protein
LLVPTSMTQGSTRPGLKPPAERTAEWGAAQRRQHGQHVMGCGGRQQVWGLVRQGGECWGTTQEVGRGRGRQSYAAGQQATKVPPAFGSHPAPPNNMRHLPATCQPPATHLPRTGRACPLGCPVRWLPGPLQQQQSGDGACFTQPEQYSQIRASHSSARGSQAGGDIHSRHSSRRGRHSAP